MENAEQRDARFAKADAIIERVFAELDAEELNPHSDIDFRRQAP